MAVTFLKNSKANCEYFSGQLCDLFGGDEACGQKVADVLCGGDPSVDIPLSVVSGGGFVSRGVSSAGRIASNLIKDPARRAAQSFGQGLARQLASMKIVNPIATQVGDKAVPRGFFINMRHSPIIAGALALVSTVAQTITASFIDNENVRKMYAAPDGAPVEIPVGDGMPSREDIIRQELPGHGPVISALLPGEGKGEYALPGWGEAEDVREPEVQGEEIRDPEPDGAREVFAPGLVNQNIFFKPGVSASDANNRIPNGPVYEPLPPVEELDDTNSHLEPLTAGGPPPLPPSTLEPTDRYRFENNRELLTIFARERGIFEGSFAAGIFIVGKNGWIQGYIEPKAAESPHLEEVVILVDHEGRIIHASAINGTMEATLQAAFGELLQHFGTNIPDADRPKAFSSFQELILERRGRLGHFDGYVFPNLIPDYRGLTQRARVQNTRNTRIIAEQLRSTQPHPLEATLRSLLLHMMSEGNLTDSDSDTPVTFIVDARQQVIATASEWRFSLHQQAAIERITSRTALVITKHEHPLELDWQLYRIGVLEIDPQARLRGQLVGDIFEQSIRLDSNDRPELYVTLYEDLGVPTLRPERSDGQPNNLLGTLRLRITNQELFLDVETMRGSWDDLFDAIRRFVLPKAKAFLGDIGRIQVSAGGASPAIPYSTRFDEFAGSRLPAEGNAGIGSVRSPAARTPQLYPSLTQFFFLAERGEAVVGAEVAINIAATRVDELRRGDLPQDITVNHMGIHLKLSGVMHLENGRLNYLNAECSGAGCETVLADLKSLIEAYNESVCHLSGTLFAAFCGTMNSVGMRLIIPRLDALRPGDEPVTFYVLPDRSNPLQFVVKRVRRNLDGTLSFDDIQDVTDRRIAPNSLPFEPHRRAFCEAFERYNEAVRRGSP